MIRPEHQGNECEERSAGGGRRDAQRPKAGAIGRCQLAVANGREKGLFCLRFLWLGVPVRFLKVGILRYAFSYT